MYTVKFLHLVAVTALFGSMACVALAADRPNIIVFLTDDQDKPSIGAYGGKAWTPNLDQMAQEGMLFNQAFVTSTVCTPSRYSFLTGRYPGRAYGDAYMKECPKGRQGFPAFNMGLEPDNMNLGAVLREAGYRTGYTGKYHVSGIEALKKQEHFEEHGLTYVAPDARDTPQTSERFRKNELGYRRMLEARGYEWVKHIYLGNLTRPYNHHNLEWTVDAALEFIEESAQGMRPFFLQLCTTLVHGPDRSWSTSMGNDLITGAGRIDTPVRPPGMATRKEILAALEERGLDPEQGHAGYSWIDAGVGAVLAKLKGLGIDENTLVIFTADHGSKMKGSLYDVAGGCVPFIARWPDGIRAGSTCDALVQSTDIAATAFDLAGAKVPPTYLLDGLSMVPLFNGAKPNDWRDHLYLELGFARAVRTEHWKYIAIRYPREQVAAIQRARPEQLPKLMSPLNRMGIGTRGAQNPNFYLEDALFHVRHDPGERKNLAGDPAFRPQLERMQALLTGDLVSMGRPYGEFVPGGDAMAPGQVEEQAALVRRIEVTGKRVTLPDAVPDPGRSRSRDAKKEARGRKKAR
jgi:arylsulfatase A-like enzyme